MPALEYLRESGRIEQSAFVVIGLRNAMMAKDTDLSEEMVREKLGVDPDTLVPVPAKPYSSYGDLEQHRLLARLAIERSSSWNLGDSDAPTLLEVYALKNRQRGKVGMVVPLVLHPRSGRITELQQTLAIPDGAARKVTLGGQARGRRGSRK